MSLSMATRAVLVDLLMATMDSISAWSAAAGDRETGLAWRDAVTDRMLRSGRYRPYRDLVEEAAAELGLGDAARDRLEEAWLDMRPWPDAEALRSASVPYAFVTNCSSRLAGLAADRSGLDPAFTLSAEEAGYYKPRPEIYHLACTRIGVHPGETRFVAGAAYDAEGAHAAGLKARLITRRPGTRLPPGPIEAVASMTAALDEEGERWSARAEE
jgi:2-haloalkanoic acid dehalogenase type II